MRRNLALVEARERARLSRDDLARKVREAGRQLGAQNGCNRNTVGRWEAGEVIPQSRMLAALEIALGMSAEQLGFGGEVIVNTMLWSVLHSFPASTLAGYWVTCYEFTHNGKQLHHADIAHVTAESDRHLRAVNHPPEPRTEGREASPFRNEIEAQLASRHLVGTWKNTSDNRYFGSVHLAVLPGETVIEGFYTGFASDILVSMSRWKWVRLEVTDPSGITLQDPSVLYKIIMAHSQYDTPLAAADISERET